MFRRPGLVAGVFALVVTAAVGTYFAGRAPVSEAENQAILGENASQLVELNSPAAITVRPEVMEPASPTPGDAFGTLDGLDAHTLSGINGLVGTKGPQVASGRGNATGAYGGSADGLGGLGTRGTAKNRGYKQEAVRVVNGAPMTGDEYRAVSENDFHAVADTPLSTYQSTSIRRVTATYADI